MIDPVPTSCLRATFSFSRFDRVFKVIPIKDIYNCFLYLAVTFRNPEGVKKLAGDQVTNCVDLFSIQEEADTRIILHALHADEQFGKSSVKGRIIIKCSDADVLVLCVHYYPCMQNTGKVRKLSR
jgi:hypothetical protein